MALNYVNLICDLYDASGNLFSTGAASFTPSGVLKDTVDHEVITQVAISAPFKASGSPTVKLLATDNVNVSPVGWTWSFSPPSGSGMSSFSFFLPFSGGATQYLSSIIQASGVPVFYPPQGIGPSGDTTGFTDRVNWQTALNLGNTSALAALAIYGTGGKPFYFDQPVEVPPYCGVAGAVNTTRVSQTGAGTVFRFGSNWAPRTITDGGTVTLNSMFILLGGASPPSGGPNHGGYSTVSEEQKFQDIMIDGTGAPAAASGASGILSYGRLQRVRVQRVLISKLTGSNPALYQQVDASGNVSDAWYGYEVFCRFCGGPGMDVHSADSTWYECLGSNNAATSGDVDLFFRTSSNSKYFNCRSEHSGGLGLGYVCTNSGQASGDVEFNGCSTDQSTKYGMQLGGTIRGVTSFVHATPVHLTGCNFRRDGANGGAGGGGYAGLYNADYGSVVTVDGMGIWPGVNDNGSGTNSPQIGLLADSGSQMAIGTSLIIAATTAITDNSGGGINYDNSVITGTGATGSPTITQSPNIAAYQGKSISLVPGSSPAADPIFVTSAASGNRFLGNRITGQGNDQFKIVAGGTHSWGPGSAAQDVALQRPSAGILSVTDAGIGGSAMLRVSASASQSGTTELFSGIANAAGDVVLAMKITADTNYRFNVDSNGKIQWGPGGTTAFDTNLYRNSAGVLKTDGALTVAGRLTASLVAAPANFKPANPTGTVSTTDVMAGFGATVTYTPGSSGKVLIVINGECNTATAVTFVNAGARFGTGTAPANGDAVTGTRFGTSSVDYQPRGSGISNQTSFGFNDILSLTAGTTYWFDIGFSTGNASDQANLRSVVFSLVELS